MHRLQDDHTLGFCVSFSSGKQGTYAMFVLLKSLRAHRLQNGLLICACHECQLHRVPLHLCRSREPPCG